MTPCGCICRDVRSHYLLVIELIDLTQSAMGYSDHTVIAAVVRPYGPFSRTCRDVRSHYLPVIKLIDLTQSAMGYSDHTVIAAVRQAIWTLQSYLPGRHTVNCRSTSGRVDLPVVSPRP
ncbi:hypothetical protein J6590_011619 [Homalodisca vitripennis]|nr:hypothetical protein J6590_011619 [Homalodisca vitripennis]